MKFNKPISFNTEFAYPPFLDIKPIESIATLDFTNGALIMIYYPSMNCYKIFHLSEENVYGEEVFITSNKNEAINRFTILTGELLNNEEDKQ